MAMSLDLRFKQELYGIIKRCSMKMTEAHKIRILNNLISVGIEEANYKLVRYVSRMGSSESIDSENTQIACKILYQFTDQNGIMIHLYRRIIYYLKESLKMLEYKSFKIYLYDCLQNLKNNKATGTDMIGVRVLKAGLPVFSKILTSFFNKSLKTGYVPSSWKKKRISPLFKNGDPGDVNNYRPISILPITMKVFEK